MAVSVGRYMNMLFKVQYLQQGSKFDSGHVCWFLEVQVNVLNQQQLVCRDT